MRNRSVQLNIRLSEEEHKKLLRSIAKSRLSASAYVRSLIDGHSPKECPPLQYHELISELQNVRRSIGSIIHLAYLTKQVDEMLFKREMDKYDQIILAIQAAVLLPEKLV